MCTCSLMLFKYILRTPWCKMNTKSDHFLNLQMFSVFKVQYHLTYRIYFNKSCIFGCLTSISIHPYMTHIYQVLGKCRKYATKSGRVPFFLKTLALTLHKMKSFNNNFTPGLKALTPPAKTGLIHQCKVGGKGHNTPHKSGSNTPV